MLLGIGRRASARWRAPARSTTASTSGGRACILGAAFALLGGLVVADLLGRVRRRLDADAAGALFLYAEAFALVLVGLSVLFPPLALVGIGLLVFLLLGGRRREGEKYAGLRILR